MAKLTTRSRGERSLGSGPAAQAAYLGQDHSRRRSPTRRSNAAGGGCSSARPSTMPRSSSRRCAAKRPDRRDIAVYVRDPHVAWRQAPQEMFLDPSHTFRLHLSRYRMSRRKPRGFFIRRLSSEPDAEAVNRIYAARGMVPVPPISSGRGATAAPSSPASSPRTTRPGNHRHGHRRRPRPRLRRSGARLLAVVPRRRSAGQPPGIGEVLVRPRRAFQGARRGLHGSLRDARQRASPSRSTRSSASSACPFFTLKRKNPINEKLFAGPGPEDRAQPLCTADRRRGPPARHRCRVTDAEGGFFRLIYGGRSIHCRESLSELTTEPLPCRSATTRPSRAAHGARGRHRPRADHGRATRQMREFLERHGSRRGQAGARRAGQGDRRRIETMEDLEAAVAGEELSDRVLIEDG
jgi:hypothetical protein